MSETKKDNGFTRWSKKHAELWKFIKYSIAGGSSSAVELIVHMVLLNTAFKVLTSVPVVNDALNMIGITSKGYLYTYLISTTIGYAIAFILNRKITFKADVNPTLSMILYAIMVVFTIFCQRLDRVCNDNLCTISQPYRQPLGSGYKAYRNDDSDIMDLSVQQIYYSSQKKINNRSRNGGRIIICGRRGLI